MSSNAEELQDLTKSHYSSLPLISSPPMSPVADSPQTLMYSPLGQCSGVYTVLLQTKLGWLCKM